MLELDEALARGRCADACAAACAPRGRTGAWSATSASRTVLDACARPREPDDGVWITPRLRRLYRRLHEAGLAHSLEIEAGDELAAGLVGVLARPRGDARVDVPLRRPHAGNVLLARTLDELAARGFELCDVQLPTDHTTRLGARLVPREDYEARLRAALAP